MRHSLRRLVCGFVPGALSAALLLAAGVGTASATTDEEAATACEQALRAEGAIGIEAVEVRREDRIPFVHGIADFGASGRVRVRCRVYQGEVSSLRYLVRNPGVSEGWLWTAERPEGAGQTEPQPGDTGAQAEPPQNEVTAPPQPQETAAPRWRNAGETDFGGGAADTKSPADKPGVLRRPGAGQAEPDREETAGAPPPEAGAGTASSDEPVSPLFLRPPG